MTIEQFYELTKDLDPTTPLFFDDGEALYPICGESVGAAEAQIGEDATPLIIFVLEPCKHEIEVEVPEVNPSLN